MERRPYAQPCTQLQFNLRGDAAAGMNLPGLTIEPAAIEAGWTLFDLSLTLEERGADTVAVLEYSVDLLEEKTAALFIEG